MNKDKILGQIHIVADMTDSEGVKQICYILEEIVNSLDKQSIGFAHEETDNNGRKS